MSIIMKHLWLVCVSIVDIISDIVWSADWIVFVGIWRVWYVLLGFTLLMTGLHLVTSYSDSSRLQPDSATDSSPPSSHLCLLLLLSADGPPVWRARVTPSHVASLVSSSTTSWRISLTVSAHGKEEAGPSLSNPGQQVAVRGAKQHRAWLGLNSANRYLGFYDSA